MGMINLLRILMAAVALSLTPVQAQYLGCFKDEGARDLNGFAETTSTTNERCRQTCAARGFQYSGTQYGAQCYCGNTYGKYGPANNCDMPCSGNPNEICGGNWANSISRVGTPVFPRGSPNGPHLISPNTMYSGWRPNIAGPSISLTWQVTGTGNNTYQVTHWLQLFRWNPAIQGGWEVVFENYVGGPQAMHARMTHTVQLARGTCYAWRVFGVDPQRSSNPWYTPSLWAGFCVA